MAKSTIPKIHHYVRTPLAALLGFLAMLLVSAAILLVWADRTLTDTNTFVQTLEPVIERPELQDFVADKVTRQLLDSAPTQDLSTQFLPAEQVAGKTPEQLKAAVGPEIHKTLVQVLRSPKLQTAWQITLRVNHTELVRQLDANSPQIALNLRPLFDAVVFEIKQTKLAPLADKLDIDPSKTTVTLSGDALANIHQSYKNLKTGAAAVVLLALLLVALSVWASVHHGKTLRRILTATGISALLVAGVVAAAPYVTLPVKDPATAKLAIALVATLLHGLQISCLILGVACLVAAIGYKLYDRSRTAPAR